MKIGAMVMAAAAGLVLLAVVLLVAIIPPGIHVSPGDGASEVKPDGQSLEISASRWGATLDTVQVKEAIVTPDGSRVNERLLDGHVQDGRFVLADGSNPLQADAEYQVTVTGTAKELSLGGIQDAHRKETHTFTTVTTPMPVIANDGVVVKYGDEVTIEWNIPVKSFEYKLDGIASTMRLENGGKVAKIALASFEQGKEYPLRITAAVSENDRELKAPIVTTVKTAPALTVAFEPADGTATASTDSHPTIVFSEAVANPEKAQALVTVDPQVAGHLNWAAPNRLEFIPDAPWDHLQDVTIRLKGGVQQLRGVSGGFVEADAQGSFTTAAYKSIDVDVTNQVVTLIEDGKVVDSYLCSTGAVGTDTPLGDYTVYAKLTAVDMRGPGYFAPKVPWVMVFKGDYTMHGNYWATSFGRRSSHGCVGLPVDTAKYVFGWTPMGTTIHIHE
ncbi:MAG: L,D-transpeptidase family protein [Thermoleophilia bacterium]